MVRDDFCQVVPGLLQKPGISGPKKAVKKVKNKSLPPRDNCYLRYVNFEPRISNH
jgi:hypothetical protein